MNAQTDKQTAFYFSIGSDYFALEGKYVKQIIELSQISQVPRTEKDFLGLIAVEGSILPLMNSQQLLKLEPVEAALAVLLGHQSKMIAFSFERVVGFFPLTESKDGAIKPAFGSFVSAVVTHDEQDYYLIDALNLIDLAEEALVVV